jgi:MerR family transcriptional regulator, heat shock protein HspR
MNLMIYNQVMSLSSPSFDASPQSGLAADRGLYPISVVTELTGIEAHTLRGYERAGLLAPSRTVGGTRRYSDNDVTRLRHIATLSGLRVNLEGIRRILLLEQEVTALKAQIARLREADGTSDREG